MFSFKFIRLAVALFVISGLAACASYQPSYLAAADLQAAQVHTQQAPAMVRDADIAAMIRYAYEHHPRIQAAKAELRSAEAQVTAAGALMDPELSLSQGLNNTDSRTIAVSQDIPIFKRRAMAVEQAQAGLRAAQARYLEEAAEVTTAVMRALIEYLYVLENIRVQQDLADLRAQLVLVAEQQYATGNISLSEFLRAQNAAAESTSDLANLQALKSSQLARVNSALSRGVTEPFESDLSLADFHAQASQLPREQSELYAELTQASPLLRVAEYELQALQVAQDIASTAGLPRLMVGLEYMNTAMESGTVSGMVGVSLPIWRGRYQAQRDVAAANVDSAIARWQSTQLELQAELSMALHQWQEADRNRQLYGDVLLPRSEQAVASLLTQYANSATTFADVLASQQEWLTFALAYQRALANQLDAVTTIHSFFAYQLDTEAHHEND